VSAVHPLQYTFDTHVFQRRTALKALLDMDEPSGWDSASDATIVGRLHAGGPWELDVLSMELDIQVCHLHIAI
jgi:hypothetical protein